MLVVRHNKQNLHMKAKWFLSVWVKSIGNRSEYLTTLDRRESANCL